MKYTRFGRKIESGHLNTDTLISFQVEILLWRWRSGNDLVGKLKVCN